MIKLKIKYGNSQTDLRFPCTEKEMSAALERIHAEDVTPLELYVSEVIFPEELGCLHDRFVNLDEVNYLGKRMDSFFGDEEYQFYEAMKLEGFDTLPDLINLSFNLSRYPLIQDISDMGKIGRECSVSYPTPWRHRGQLGLLGRGSRHYSHKQCRRLRRKNRTLRCSTAYQGRYKIRLSARIPRRQHRSCLPDNEYTARPSRRKDRSYRNARQYAGLFFYRHERRSAAYRNGSVHYCPTGQRHQQAQGRTLRRVY